MKELARHLLRTSIACYLVHIISAQNPCTDNVQIDSNHRSFDSGISDLPISDKLTIREDVYYRFTDGYNNNGRILDIASKVESGKCGTKWPIFLEHLHPRESSSAGYACEIPSSLQGRGHCENRYEVKITHCKDKRGGYFVYKLKTPVTNDAAYCIDFRPFTSEENNESFPTTPNNGSIDSGNGVFVTCNNVEFVVIVDIEKFKSLFPDINPWHLVLGDQDCLHDGATTRNDSLKFAEVYEYCNTQKKVVDGKVWYTNQLLSISYFEEDEEDIARDKSFSMNVTCVMDQDVHVNVSFEAADEHIEGETVAGNGEFTLSMNFYTDSSFTVPITDVPVKLSLGKQAFVQLELKDSTDPSLTLVHQDTVATPYADFMEGETDPQYYLVKNRCPDDETTKLHPSGEQQLRYSFSSFRFPSYDLTVYLHTFVKVCAPEGSPGVSCQRICLSSSHHRVARDASADVLHRVFNGPLILSDDDDKEGKQFNQNDTKTISKWTGPVWMLVAMAGCVMVSLSIYVAKTMRHGPYKMRSS